jgi:cytochrome c-type biogenesis protein CcmE
MNKRFVILVVVVMGAAIGLMYQASTAGTSHVYSPSELAGHQGGTIPRLRVAGRVAEGSEISYVTEPRAELRFSIVDPPPKIAVTGLGSGGSPQAEYANQKPSDSPGESSSSEAQLLKVPVVYQGLRPDMFSAGRDVIIDGEYRDGLVIASTLLTQCPSKYEAPSPEERYLNQEGEQ